MIRYITRLDRIPVLIMAVVIGIFALLTASELAAQNQDGLVASLSPYFAILLAVGWAAPAPARELESGSATWAWSMGVTRRRWLLARVTPLLSTAIAGGLVIGGLVALTQRYWFPSMTEDRITGPWLTAAMPVTVALAVFGVGLGTATALVTRKVVPAVGTTLIGQVAVIYAAPALGIALAPRTTSNGTRAVLGHVVGQDVVGGIPQITYVANTAFWPIAWTLAAGLVVLGAALAGLALHRVARIDA